MESVAVFLRELLAAGRSPATLRSYGMDLLRWWRFLRAVDVDWRRAPLVHNVHKTKRPPANADGRLAWSEPLSLVAGTVVGLTGFEPATSGMSDRSRSSAIRSVSSLQVIDVQPSQLFRPVPLVRVGSTVFRVQIRVHHTRQERFSIARCSAVTSSRLCWVSM